MIKFFDEIFKSIISDFNSLKFTVSEEVMLGRVPSYEPKKILEEIEKSEKIFPNKEPSLKDLGQQGKIGDCSFLSALGSIVKTDLGAIKHCFMQIKNNDTASLENLKNQEKIKIRLFTIDNEDLLRQYAIRPWDKKITIYVNSGKPRIYEIGKKLY